MNIHKLLVGKGNETLKGISHQISRTESKAFTTKLTTTTNETNESIAVSRTVGRTVVVSRCTVGTYVRIRNSLLFYLLSLLSFFISY